MADEPQQQPQPQTQQPAADGHPKGAKQFSLKPIENQMLNALQDQYFAGLSNFLSFVCLERLAYQVTPLTKFEITDGNLYVWEAEAPAAPAAPAQPTPGGNDAASVA